MVSTIALGADHAGYGLKEALKAWLINHGYQVLDLGTHSTESVDYPDYAALVAESVADHKVERGLLICGTGIGMCIAANKVRGARAAPCHDSITAELSRRHNDSNILCLSADLLGEELIERMIRIWLETPFDGGRHARRVEKIMKYEGGEGRT